MRYSLAIPIVVLVAGTLRAGTITTTDGETFTGDLKRTEDGYTITQPDGQVKSLLLREVKTIELDGGAQKPGRAVEGLSSLRRSVEFSDDVPRILQRYQTFLTQAKDPAVIADAKKDMAVWQDRQDRGLVKFGKDWMPAADRDAEIRDLRQQAQQARLLIKDKRDRDADEALNAILQEDPQNVSALYLRGVLAQKRGDNPEAKKAFQGVQQTLPQHAPTLLNLALVNVKQKQWAAACVALQQSIEAAPVTQVLLDTTAEFLNLLPADIRRGSAAQKLQREFLDQDKRLQELMAAKHMYRWGGSWVDQAAYDDIHKTNDSIQKKIDDLQKQFDESQQRITLITKQIGDNQYSMREMEQHSYTTLPDGTTLRTPLPMSFYDLQSENVKLNTEKNELSSKLDGFRNDARDAQKGLKVATYSGILTPIDEDGVPLVVLPDDPPAAPATAPAAVPAPSTAPSTVIRIGPASAP